MIQLFHLLAKITSENASSQARFSTVVAGSVFIVVLKEINVLIQVSEAGVHRPHVAGIHGREDEGAYSIVLSGGYEDDTVSFWKLNVMA